MISPKCVSRYGSPLACRTPRSAPTATAGTRLSAGSLGLPGPRPPPAADDGHASVRHAEPRGDDAPPTSGSLRARLERLEALLRAGPVGGGLVLVLFGLLLWLMGAL
mgnify:CR=1 FL=1